MSKGIKISLHLIAAYVAICLSVVTVSVDGIRYLPGIYVEASSYYKTQTDYQGFYMLQGKVMNILCVTETLNKGLWFNGITEISSSSGPRFNQTRNGNRLNTRITDVQPSDAGSYSCTGDRANVRVTNTEDVPQNITSYWCVKTNSSITCFFQSNIRRYDGVTWYIGYSTNKELCGEELREDGLCPCNQTVYESPETGYDIITCFINENVDPSVTEFRIKGINEFAKYNDSVLGIELSSILEHPDPTLLPVRTTVKDNYRYTGSTEAQMNISNSIFVQENYYSKPYYPTFSGYLARKGSEIIIYCKKEKLRHGHYNMTALGDDRVIQREDEHWLNTTIRAVGYEDTGVWSCGSDATVLRITDPDKEIKIKQQECISNVEDTFNDMVCKFYMNSKKREMLRYSISISLRGDNSSDTIPVCEIMRLSLSDKGEEIITCTIKDFMKGAVHDFNIKAETYLINVSILAKQTLDSSIARLPAVQLLDHTTTVDSAILKVAVPGNFSKYSSQMINYRVVDSTHYINQLYSVPGSEAILVLTNLTQFTRYSLSIQCQLNDTANLDVWSTSVVVAVHTSETVPDKAPEHSMSGLSVSSAALSCKGRLMRLFWKPMAEEANITNGVLESYKLYTSDLQIFTEGQGASVNLPQNFHQQFNLVRSVKGTENSVLACVTPEIREIAIVPSTSEGAGKMMARYVVPPTYKEPLIKPCDVKVTVSDHNILVIKWVEPNDGRYNYTVYWCEDSQGSKECVDGTFQWENVGSFKSFRKSLLSMPRTKSYRFGVSATRLKGSRKTSGIVWAKCIDNKSKKLRAASLNVQIVEREARVSVLCPRESKMPDYYLITACLVEKRTGSCSRRESVMEKTLLPCEDHVTLELDSYSSNYSFKVISVLGNQRIESIEFLDTTGNRKLLMYEVALILVFMVVLVFCVSFFSVWFYKQKKLAKTLRSVHLVKPQEFYIECDTLSIKDDDDDDDEGSDKGYMVAGNQYERTNNKVMNGVLKSSSSEMTDSDLNIPNEYLHCSEKAEQLEPLQTNYNNTHQSNQSNDYKPVPTSFNNWNPYTSYRALPDNYLQHAGTDSQLSLSSQLFYNDYSDGNDVIDLFKFVDGSESSLQDESADGNESCNLTAVILPANTDNCESNSGGSRDTGYETSVREDDCTSYHPDTSDDPSLFKPTGYGYIKVSDTLICD